MGSNLQINNDLFKGFIISPYSVRTQNLGIATTQTKSDTVTISSNNKDRNYKKYTIAGVAIIALGLLIAKRNKISKICSKLFKNEKNITADIKKGTENIDEPIIIKSEELTKTNSAVEETTPRIIEEVDEIKPRYVIDKVKGIVTKNVECEQAQKEVYSSKIYELAGVKTSKIGFIGGENNYTNSSGVESKFIEGLKDLSEEELSSHANICKDFGADILLANRNVLKSCKLDKNNNLIRVDMSDTLGLNPDGSQHHFGIVVDELSDFLNPEKYPQNAKAYSSLTRETLISSLEKVCSMNDKDISYKDAMTLSDSSSILNSTKCFDALEARKNFLKTVLDTAKNTEQNSLTIFEYANKIKNESIIKIIEQAEHYNIIKDIENSIDNIENNETRAMLSSLLKKRIKLLTTDKENPNEVSCYEIGKILEKYSHKSYQPTEQEILQIKENYGDEYARPLIRALKKPLTNLRINEMTKIANMNNGKYLEFWKNNPEKMVIYINSDTTTAGQVDDFNEAAWDIIIGDYKLFCEKKFDKEAVDAVIRYGELGVYDGINGFLRFDNKVNESLKLFDEPPSTDSRKKLRENLLYLHKLTNERLGNFGKNINDGDNIQKEICEKLNILLGRVEQLSDSELINIKEELNNLRVFMKSLAVNSNVKRTIDRLKKNFILSGNTEKNLVLVRKETTDSFESLFLDGENLAKLMIEAREKPAVREKILEHFNKSKPSLHQPGFLSTSISPYSTLAGTVKWILKLDKNVKYSYVSDLAHILGGDKGGTEAELLVHPGHNIKILSAKFDNSNLKWTIGGIISPE